MEENRRKYFDCVGVGICALDHLALLPHFPSPDEKLDLLEFSVQGGGPVPTALATMARLGSRVTFVGKVGSDECGRTVLGELESFGVDVSGAVIDPHSRTARAYIWIDRSTAKRTVALDRTNTANLRPKEVRQDLISEGTYLLTDARETEVALEVVRKAKSSGSQIVLDLGNTREQTEAFLELADFPVVSQTFVDAFWPGTDPAGGVRKLLDWGAKAAVVTCGPEGAFFGENGQVWKQPAFSVKAVDTTGAGDVFHGAFVYGLTKGWSLAEVVRFSAAAAALKCRKIGGRVGIPKHDEVRALLEKQPSARAVKVD